MTNTTRPVRTRIITTLPGGELAVSGHRFTTRADAEAYIERLESLDAETRALEAALRERGIDVYDDDADIDDADSHFERAAVPACGLNITGGVE